MDKPPSNRAALFDMVAVIRSRIKRGDDKTLTALSLSHAGITHFLCTNYDLPRDPAELLAAAACELIERHGA